jgi:restriction endonuclease
MSLYFQFNNGIETKGCDDKSVLKKSDVDSIEEAYDYFDTTLKRDPYDNCDMIVYYSKP